MKTLKSKNMFKIRNYLWVFIVASGLLAVVFSNVCCTGKASNNGSAYASGISTAATEENSGPGVITLTDNTFDDQIRKGVVLVDFWATWCRPCRMQAPIIEEVSSEIGTKASICKMDVDKNPVMSEKYSVQSIPTLLIFKDGKIVGKFLGVTAKDDIINELKKHIQ